MGLIGLIGCPISPISPTSRISPIPDLPRDFFIGGEFALMKTLLLNPPSFEKFDGGASSRWPATREIESYWYPVWLAYPAAMIRDLGGESRLLDAPPHHIGPEETAQIAKDYEFVILFTSHVSFKNDVRLAERMKELNPTLKIAFVGPPVTTHPEQALRASGAVDFVTHKEF